MIGEQKKDEVEVKAEEGQNSTSFDPVFDHSLRIDLDQVVKHSQPVKNVKDQKSSSDRTKVNSRTKKRANVTNEKQEVDANQN